MESVTLSLQTYENLKSKEKALIELLSNSSKVITLYNGNGNVRYILKEYGKELEQLESEIIRVYKLYYDEKEELKNIKEKIKKSFFCKILKIK